MRKIKQIVVLAGGESKRFWPLQDKNMFVFLGKPLIVHQIEYLASFAERLYIVANNQTYDGISYLFAKDAQKIHIVRQQEEGQAGALLSVADLVHSEVMVVNANDFFSGNPIANVLQKAHTTGADCLLTAKKVSRYFPGGYIRYEKDTVLEVVEKPGEKHTPSEYVRLVADYFKNFDEFITALQKTTSANDDRYEKALTSFIEKGKKVAWVPYEDEWYSLKYPWHVLGLQNFFLSQMKGQKGTNITIHKSAHIEGTVYMGDNVKIYHNAIIIGPCYIGKNSIIGSHSLVIESAIGENCVIGGYSEVTRSYLGDNVMLHRNYVGDSVLDTGVFMGAGAVLANFRFDAKSVLSAINGERIDTGLQKCGAMIGAYAKIGVQSTVLPGIKIGSNTIIGPASLVEKDIEEKKFLYRGEIIDNKNT